MLTAEFVSSATLQANIKQSLAAMSDAARPAKVVVAEAPMAATPASSTLELTGSDSAKQDQVLLPNAPVPCELHHHDAGSRTTTRNAPALKRTTELAPQLTPTPEPEPPLTSLPSSAAAAATPLLPPPPPPVYESSAADAGNGSIMRLAGSHRSLADWFSKSYLL
jgi:hypothetical protein